ncbi:MAG: stage II sporulation protein M [Candidatus Altiarchaeota archaeon]|nr:stage II sporulation protein M [Candidatus Altiarchaeota archaeon]
MVLESIVVPSRWEKHPGRMLYIGFAYASVGLLLGFFVFGSYASLSAIFLTTMPLVVIMYKALTDEEGKDCRVCGEISMLKEHAHILYFFTYLFIGIVLAYSVWSAFLPEDVSENLFSYQTEIIEAISDIGSAGAFHSQANVVWLILSNNLVVLGFCILFSFLYGCGAIFILTMNASILGVAIGSGVKTMYGEGLLAVVSYSSRYLIHGIPEILSYFIGALAGGILSSAVINHHYKTPKFKKIMVDVAVLTALSVMLLVASAFVEVYATPNLF